MTRRILLHGLTLGALAFVVQLALVSLNQFGGLSPRASALAMQSLARIGSSPNAVLWIAFYAALGVLTHAIPFSLALKLAADLRERAKGRVQQFAMQRGFAVLSLLAVFATMVAWDRWLFPSHIAMPPEGPLELALHYAPVVITSACVILLVATWLVHAASRRFVLRALAVSCVTIAAGYSAERPMPPPRASSAPDIIVLGVDSLRPDHLGAFGAPSSPAPGIDAFVNDAVAFDNTYTPLSRTFVAYMSVLSGRYPVHNRVRENLFPRRLFSRRDLLPAVLRERGYETVFALDEVRFANVDQSFGFDHVVSPPAGVVELVAGTLYDGAGTNLLQAVPGTRHLLPHIAGNRALQTNYRPESQVAKVRDAIQDAPADKPLFLVAHYCMPHTPFAGGIWRREQLPPSYRDSPRHYRKAVSIADQQVTQTLAALRDAGRLRNAIVVMISDHGEGLGMRKDAWRDTPGGGYVAPGRFGHGAASLEDSQTRVLLAVQRFRDGRPVWKPAHAQAPASLVDIAPTVLAAADVPATATPALDGVNLVDRDGTPVAPAVRPVFIESGIFGRSLDALQVDNQAVANEFYHLYEVVDDLRLELRSDKLPELMRSKQRAVVLGHYGVANMPEATADGCWMLVDYRTRDRNCIKDATGHPVVDAYSRLICRQYAGDAAFEERWCRHAQSPGPLAARHSANTRPSGG